MTLQQTVKNILKTYPNQGFTAKELAQKIYENNQDACLDKMKRTTVTTEQQLVQQLAKEISARTFRDILSDDVKITVDRPRKYFYAKDEIYSEDTSEKREYTQREKELYQKACQYLYSELNIYSMRINEKKGHNKKGKNGNIWLNPDIVGVKVLSENWCPEVKNCINKMPYNQTDMWSFEVKDTITTANLRRDFFQTVSNSSWANYSYLIAGRIDEKAEDELRLLCKSFNIGVIILNDDDPSIFIPAARKENADWNMINRITEVNDDMKSFINLVTEFYQTGKIKKHEWNIKE